MKGTYSTIAKLTAGFAVVLSLCGASAAQDGATVRRDLDRILLKYNQIASNLGDDVLATLASSGRVQLASISDEQLNTIAGASSGIALLRQQLDDLKGRSGETPRTNALPAVTDFPAAPYSGVCSDNRTNSDAMFAASLQLNIARTVHAGVSRVCDQDVLGNNSSVACLAVDIALALAEGIMDQIKFCDDDVDSAEIAGSYARLAHLNEDIHTATDDEIARDDEFIRWELEGDLAIKHRGERKARFMLPESMGGRLNQAREVVLDTINLMLTAKQDIHNAQLFLDRGDQFKAMGAYKAAYDEYSRAYVEASR